jgi:outer membrane protein OmpA-like peptidoglycan-associated protein
MNTSRFPSLSVLALAAVTALAACSTLPADNARLMAARSDYQMAADSPQTRELAAVELKQAADALQRANDAQARKAKVTEVDHLAYLASSRVAIANETASRKTSEQAIVSATAARDQMRLTARTNEADAATRSAASSQRQADASQRQADSANQQANLAQQQANASQQQAAVSQQQAQDALARSAALEAQIKDLNAKQTDRGLVVTFGDVLFDVNQAQLKSGGLRNVDKLVGFLKAYPQRKAMVEGFTDSTGSEATNEALSARRADAVRAALVERGVGGDRLSTQGYGEAFPVAGNDSAGGRQMNRRVEIVLSDDSGKITPR